MGPPCDPEGIGVCDREAPPTKFFRRRPVFPRAISGYPYRTGSPQHRLYRKTSSTAALRSAAVKPFFRIRNDLRVLLALPGIERILAIGFDIRSQTAKD